MATTDEIIKGYQEQYAKAKAAGDTAGMAEAHTGAEAERLKLGYSGGVDGSSYIKITNPENSNALPSATSLSKNIDSLYSAQQQQALADLKTAYDQNVIDLNATAAKIPATYNTARNSTAAVSAQNRASFNEAAAANGLNSGTGGQASLSMSNALSGNLSSLDRQQASDMTDIETQRLKLSTTYNNSIQQAISENNIAKAQALYNEAVRVDNSLVSTAQANANYQYNQQQYQYSQNQYSDEKALTYAKILASYGNFSALKTLLDLDDADEAQLYKVWASDNQKAAAARGV